MAVRARMRICNLFLKVQQMGFRMLSINALNRVVVAIDARKNQTLQLGTGPKRWPQLRSMPERSIDCLKQLGGPAST